MHRPTSVLPTAAARRSRSLVFLPGILAASVILVTLDVRTSAREAAPGATSAQAAPRAGDETFGSVMEEAMARMHRDMHVTPSGDPDRDFARMMIPHHQGAVDMALAELRFGRDDRLRRLAQEIIVEQRDEIAVMKAILDAAPAARPATPPARH